MPNAARAFVSLAILVLASGCASRSLPKYEQPLARARFQTVRTTAYTHSESDHRRYGRRNALGGTLSAGEVKSAACDWSRWPVGTVFRLQETGETYVVDDYGWALAGRNTIDLYKPSRTAMNGWGVRRVNIEILQWGDADRSLAILSPRVRHPHVRRMVTDLRRRYAELCQPLPEAQTVALRPAAEPTSAEQATVPDMETPLAASFPNPARSGGFRGAGPQLTPFRLAP